MVAAKTDPFREFANQSEMPLRNMRARLFAIHTMLETGKDPGEEALDAVCCLVAESLGSVDRVLESHGAAYRQAQEVRS